MHFCCSLHPTALRAARNQLASLILDLIPRKQSCVLPGITFFIISNHFPGRSDLCDNGAGDRVDVSAFHLEDRRRVGAVLDGSPSEGRVDPETTLVHTYAHVNVLRNPEGLSPVWVISDARYFCHCLISSCYLFHK